jgi:hypothetical protein
LSEPKRQHYIPQMLLRRFTDSDGRLHFFDKRIREKGVLQSSPKDIFVQKHIYSSIAKDGTKDTTLEKYYSFMEGRADRLIEKIIVAARAEKLPNLSEKEKEEWDNFVYQQWSRVPDMHVRSLNDFDDTFESSIREFEQTFRPLTDQEKASLQEPETRARILQNARVTALSGPPGLAVETLGLRGLGVCALARRNKSFIVGSSPVTKLAFPGRSHLSDPSVELWLPIAFDVAVTPAGTRGTERFVKVSDDRHIRALNEAIFKQSTLIAGRSTALIASLTATR